jgi:Chromate transport protein ChrA
MTYLYELLILFYTFLKVGLLGFGGGYAMMSMIMVECEKLSITVEQFADLNALDMVVPGPIAINAATYVGYLYAGFWGSVVATVAVSLPPFILVTLVMHFMNKFKKNKIMLGALAGIKPAAVGLIAAAAVMIAEGVLLVPGMGLSAFFANPLGTVSFLMVGIFAVTAVANIKFKVNPILLTVLAGIVGAIFAG